MPGSTLQEHPDAGRDGLRRVLVDGAPLLTVARAGALHPLDGTLAELLHVGRERLEQAVDRALQRPALTAPATLLAPVDKQEVWASGVTYRRSATRASRSPRSATSTSSSTRPSAPSCSSRRPRRASRRPGAPLRVRADSTWDVPEPELALVLDARAQIVGYLAADDVSSRSIEGANPLYLPQAKIYDDSLGLSGTIVLARDARDPR